MKGCQSAVHGNQVQLGLSRVVFILFLSLHLLHFQLLKISFHYLVYTWPYMVVP